MARDKDNRTGFTVTTNDGTTEVSSDDGRIKATVHGTVGSITTYDYIEGGVTLADLIKKNKK